MTDPSLRIARGAVEPPEMRSLSQCPGTVFSRKRWHVILLACCLMATTQIGLAQPAGVDDSPAIVTVGAHINDIQAVDLREHSYAVDIYLWFRWHDPQLDPAATFEMVNPFELWGHVRTNIYEAPIQLPNGDLYQVVRVQGKFTKKFFFYNYPFDQQKLTIELEDSAHETNRLQYHPDEQRLTINPDLKLPGFKIGVASLDIETREYPTAFGDMRRSEPNSYSRVRIDVPIQRPIFTSCIKNLFPLICVVIGGSLMLRLRVTYVDARIGVGITALLTVVAIQLASNDNMPNVDYLIFMDKIDLCAYAYVLTGLAIVLSTIRQLDHGDHDSAAVTQRIGFWIATLCFTVVVVALTCLAIIEG